MLNIESSFVSHFSSFFERLTLSLQISWSVNSALLIALFSPALILFLYRLFHLKEPEANNQKNLMLFQAGYILSLMGLLLFMGLSILNRLINNTTTFFWIENGTFAPFIVMGGVMLSVGHITQIAAFERQEKEKGIKRSFSLFHCSLVMWAASTAYVFLTV